jgi:FkbM family methyltransferase
VKQKKSTINSVGKNMENNGLSPKQMIFLRLRNFTILASCDKIDDRIRLLIWALLEFMFPKTVPIFSSFKHVIRLMEDKLLRGIVINWQGNRFYLQNFESLTVTSSEFEPFVKKCLVLHKGDVFLDVGANTGIYTVRAAKTIGPSGLVIAIEPDPGNFECLKKNIALNNFKNVIAYNFAAWSHKENLKLFISEFTASHSTKRDFGLGHIKVKAISLDEIIHNLDVKRVDFAKIDVEGAELEVLKGFSNTMRKLRISIIVEIWEREQARVEEIKAFAKRLNYGLERIGPEYYLILPLETTLDKC